MGKQTPVDWSQLVPEGSTAWADALRLHGTVANDNGHNYRRRSTDGREPPVLQLSVAAPKAS